MAIGLGGAAAALLAACGGAAPTATGAPKAAEPTKPAAAPTAASTAAPAAAPTTAPTPAAKPAEATKPAASVAPTVAPTAAATALKLIPDAPAKLGAPATPAAARSTASNPAPLANVLAPYAAFGTTAAPGAFPRVIRHALGETTVAAAPTKVIVLDTGELDAMVQLGIRPIGAAEYQTTGLPAYLLPKVEGIKVVGTTAQPDLETITALKPDLILSSKLRHEKIYSLLTAIAPTVLVDRPGVTFKQNMALYAQAVGAEQRAAEVVKTYEERVRKLNAALPTPRPTVSIVQMRANILRFYQRSNFLGMVLDDLGFPRPAAQNVDDFGQDLGQEMLSEYAAGDLILLAVQGGEGNAFAKSVLAGDIWKTLPAVKAGKTLAVDDSTWIGGIGYGAAFEILAGLAKHFNVQ
jgi:iron complex transport system substrate-binding protein